MPAVTRTLLADRVYEHLLDQLSARQMPLGAKVNPATIARELGMSRTTVNKALARLTDEGWLQPDQSRRSVVVAYPRPRKKTEQRPFAFANQTEQTYELILERILRGDLPPGEVLKERRLAQEMGVNAVTVHRAAEWLSKDGLLVRRPRSGWQVVALRLIDLKDVYRIRLLLEPMAVERATPRITDGLLDELEADCVRMMGEGEEAGVYNRRRADMRFHQALAEASGSRMLAATLEPLIRRSILTTTVRFRFGRVSESFAQHREVIRGLRARNRELAVAAIKHHLRDALQQNVRVWEPN
jgi:DNA-binding GntR family transcriptional regulator